MLEERSSFWRYPSLTNKFIIHHDLFWRSYCPVIVHRHYHDHHHHYDLHHYDCHGRGYRQRILKPRLLFVSDLVKHLATIASCNDQLHLFHFNLNLLAWFWLFCGFNLHSANLIFVIKPFYLSLASWCFLSTSDTN